MLKTGFLFYVLLLAKAELSVLTKTVISKAK
jgi:hypothetical protein